MPPTSVTSFWKCGPEPAVTKRRFLLVTFFACTNAMPQPQGWRVEVISASDGEHGGFKEVIANIHGAGAYAKLKFESGVHRVQRVPDTETQGRIHTSAATVAVLPEAEEVDIKIEDKDLRIDVYRSSGPGGQSVNTTDSRGARHPSSDWPFGCAANRKVAAQEQEHGDEAAAGEAL